MYLRACALQLGGDKVVLNSFTFVEEFVMAFNYIFALS